MHLNAGIAGLVACMLLGARRGYGTDNLAPYDLSLAVIGTGLLWVGWFGFNGGSALGANSRAGFAVLATHLAACSGVITWMAAGVVGSRQAVGARHDLRRGGRARHHHAGIRFRAAVAWRRHRHRRRRDLLLGLHAAEEQAAATTTRSTCSASTASAASTGTILAGVFAVAAVGDTAGLLEGNAQQVLIQFYGVAVTLAWSGIVTFVLLKVIGFFLPLRVHEEHERIGLDVSLHGESLQ